MDEVFDVEPSTRGLESVGPFSVHKITLDGFAVPFLQGREDENGDWHLMLDERFGMIIPKQYANEVVWLIANAHAIGAGYSCFGENSQIANPYKCRMTGFHCGACKTTKNLHVDHVKPVSCGGTSDDDNLQLLCGSCNSKKSDKTIDYREAAA